MESKYPHVSVQMLGESGNAMSIIGRVAGALLRAKVPKEEVDEFVEEAMSGDYDHVLQTVLKTVETY